MDISVVVLTYNEEKNIQACLAALLAQEFSAGQWEIVVVDGQSQDKTVEVVGEMQKMSDRLRLITNEKKQIAAGRNLGVREGRYPFIAFTDADCVVPKNWLPKLSAEYERLRRIDPKIAGVGGGNVPFDNGSQFSQALGVYLDSFLGSFNSVQGRNFSQVKKVASLACLNVLYKKALLLEAGLFDEQFGNIVEDADINFRLGSKGYSLYFVPRLAVAHKLPLSLMSWLRKMALYGQGRARFSSKHHDYRNVFFLLPFLFVLGLVSVPLGLLFPIFFVSWLYFPFIFLYAGALALKRKKLTLFPLVAAVFIATHFVYAFTLVTKFAQIQLSSRGYYK